MGAPCPIEDAIRYYYYYFHFRFGGRVCNLYACGGREGLYLARDMRGVRELKRLARQVARETEAAEKAARKAARQASKRSGSE